MTGGHEEGNGVGIARNPEQFACVAKFATSAEFDRMAEFGAGVAVALAVVARMVTAGLTRHPAAP